MSYFELYLPYLFEVAVSIFFLFLGLLLFAFLKYTFSKKRFKQSLFLGLAGCLSFWFCFGMAEMSSEGLLYFFKILRVTAVTTRDDLHLSGEAQMFHDKRVRLQLRTLRLSGPNFDVPIEHVSKSLNTTDVMPAGTPDYEFRKFILLGRTSFSNGRPYLFESEGKRVWFKYD